jgi:hypothetical protein
MLEPSMQAGFGLGRLHHVFSAHDRERIVLGAIDAGFRHFDLAPAYGDGLAERELGRILGSRRPAVSITTKFGIPVRPIGELPMPVYFALRAGGKALRTSFGANYRRRDFSPKELVASLEASLRRMRTDYVDYLLAHEPTNIEQCRSLRDAWPEMERQVQRGKLRHFGISTDTQLMLDAEKEGLIPEAAVRMVPMNDVTCGLAASWFQNREVFVFNIVKHLSRSLGPGRIDARTLVEAFARALPAGRPIFATHNLADMKKMGDAIASLPRPSQSVRVTP